MDPTAFTQPAPAHRSKQSSMLEPSQINAQQCVSLAESLLSHRELRKALPAFDTAERHGADPDRCSAGRWMAFMLLGRFEEAWQESDAIRERGTPDPNRFW